MNVGPFLNSIAPNFENGVNFAIAGATTTNKSSSLEVQKKQLLRLQNVSAELQTRGYTGLIDQKDFNEGLFIINIGQNDLVLDYSGIPIFIASIETTIRSIYQLGGRNYWVHSTGPYGCLPLILKWNKGKVNSTDYDEYRCIKSFIDAAKKFNYFLSFLCEKMRNELIGVTIVYVDVYTIKYNLIAYPGLYGFQNPLEQCWDAPKLCQDGSTYISWDGAHYTEAANRVVASMILSKNFSKPPLAMDFFCVN